jgi:hypothetical protein
MANPQPTSGGSSASSGSGGAAKAHGGEGHARNAARWAWLRRLVPGGRAEGFARYDTRAAGWAWLRLLVLVTVAVALLYCTLHIMKPAESTLPKSEEMASPQPDGSVLVASAEDILWIVGEAKAAPVVALLSERNEEIGRLRSELQRLVVEFNRRVRLTLRGQGKAFDTALRRWDYEAAVNALQGIQAALAPGTLTSERMRILIELETVIKRLAELKKAQSATVATLRTPNRYLVFWSNPHGLLWEVVFWCLFGLLANLLYHTAEHLARNDFRPSESAVGLAKVIYTPFLAVAIILAFWAGLLELGGPETRAWALPLFGFLVGFSSRKAVDLVDRVGHWFFSRADRSLERDEAQPTATAAATARLQQLLRHRSSPQTFPEVKTEAKILSTALLREEIAAREKQI